MNLLPVIFTFIKNHMPIFFIGILVVVVGVQQLRITYKDTTIAKLEGHTVILTQDIDIANQSIATLKKSIEDTDAKIVSVTNVLKDCQLAMVTQATDFKEIGEIMASEDAPAISVVADSSCPVDLNGVVPTQGVTNETKISNTTNSKGIDFINKQFSVFE